MKRNFISFLKYTLMAMSMAGLVVMTGCGDDEGEPVDPLVGTYVLSNATLTADLTITILGMQEPTPLPAGESAVTTTLIFGILANAGPCTENPETTTIELAEDGTFYYGCQGTETRQDSGSWTSTDDSITLTINSESLGVVQILVTDYTIDANSFSGLVSSFPVPIDMNQDFGAPLEGTDPAVLNVQLASVDLTFTKIQ